MKVVVTGGAGFIGSHIVDGYIDDGHDVIVIDNLSTGKRENVHPKAKLYEVDVCSPELIEIFKQEKPEVVNNHAAQIDVRKSVADPGHDATVNIIGFLNVMEAARANGLKQVVFASSGGTVYGEQKEYPATEEHTTNPICPYGVAKLTCEKYLHYYYKQYGISYTILRYANVYGPRQNAHGEAGVVAIFTNKLLKGEEPTINGDGKQTRDYVFVGDIKALNMRAVAEPAAMQGAFNVGTGIETDVNQLFAMIRDAVGSQAQEKRGPAQPGETMRSSIVSNVIQEYIVTNLADGLKQTIEWRKGENK